MKSGNHKHLPPLATLPELIERAERVATKLWAAVADSDGNSVFGSSAGVGFLMVEAETGSIFAAMARDAKLDTEVAQRNIANATRAYDTVLRFRDRVRLSLEESAELSVMVEKLRGQLQDLGAI